MKNPNGKRKEPTWGEVGKAIENWGWSTIKIDDRAAIFERGRNRIVAKRVLKDKWKLLYYKGSYMDYTTSITGSRFAKIEAMEMGLCS